MKIFLKNILFLLAVFSVFLTGFVSTEAYVSVKGYFRKDGTYVSPHVRSDPNGLKYDNYSWTPSQGLYNKTYGTKDSDWDTPTYITDPNYYEGKTLYQSRLSGNSSSYSYSSSSCPANSYLSGDSCKCNSGYVVSGSSCISGNTYCSNINGSMSTYDSFSNSCKCISGYKLDSSEKCVSNLSYCTNIYGYGAEYSSLEDSCVCKNNYVYDSTTQKCKFNLSPSFYSTFNLLSCPSNSSEYSGSCYCDTGYKLSADKDSCVLKSDRNKEICQESFGLNSSWDNTENKDGTINCICNSGYDWSSDGKSCVLSCDKDHVLSGNKCISLDESCQLNLGFNSIGVIGSKNFDNTNKCQCKSGYKWNEKRTSCVSL